MNHPGRMVGMACARTAIERGGAMRKTYHFGRAMVVLAGLAALGGCAAMLDPRGVGEQAASLVPSERSTDKAMSALARGDTAGAESNALAALRLNPKDPHALLVAGLTYQSTGRYELARQYYDVIISNQLQGTWMVPGPDGVVQPRQVLDVARDNMEVVNRITGHKTARSISQSGRAPGIDPVVPPAADAEANVAGRFRILKALLSEGLITPDEYTTRRTANVGALLPFTTPVPSAGLERPIPADRQIIDRLKALKAAVEAREIPPREQSEERAAILDRLLPAGGAFSPAVPPLPPKDLLEAGQAVGRLERMRAAGLISADEAAREKTALDRALESQLAGKRVDGTATGLRYGPLNERPAVSSSPLPAANGHGSGWGVALASAKSEDGARKLWDTIKGKFPEELGSRQAAFPMVQAKGKTARWRVVVGPLDGKDAARKLCKTLKLHRQACDPAAFP